MTLDVSVTFSETFVSKLRRLFLIINNKIWPYLIIGALLPLFVKIQGLIISSNFIKEYFVFVGIEPNLLNDYNNIIKEHIAEYTIIYGFIILLIFSSFMRIILGQINENNRMYQYIISPLRDFLLDLSISLIGLLSGLTLISLFYDYKRGMLFFVTLIVPFCFCFMIVELSSVPISPPSNRGLFKIVKNPLIRTRVDGLLLLILAFLTFTFHRYIFFPLELIEKLLE